MHIMSRCLLELVKLNTLLALAAQDHFKALDALGLGRSEGHACDCHSALTHSTHSPPTSSHLSSPLTVPSHRPAFSTNSVSGFSSPRR